MERVTHSSMKTERGSRNKTRLNRLRSDANIDTHISYSSVQLQLRKKVRTRKRRHYDNMEVPAI